MFLPDLLAGRHILITGGGTGLGKSMGRRFLELDVLTLEGDRIKEVTAFITRAADLPDAEAYARWPAQPDDEEMARIVFEAVGLPRRIAP